MVSTTSLGIVTWLTYEAGSGTTRVTATELIRDSLIASVLVSVWGRDLVLVRFPDIDQEDLLVAVHHLLELGRRDGGAGGGLLSLIGDHAAERLVVNQPGDGGIISAYRAIRILADADRPVAHLQRVIDHQPADQRLADPRNHLDGLVDLDRADGGAQHAEDAALGARGNHARRRRLRVKAAIAGTVVGPEHAGLA